jgi:hypothetical protein
MGHITDRAEMRTSDTACLSLRQLVRRLHVMHGKTPRSGRRQVVEAMFFNVLLSCVRSATTRSKFWFSVAATAADAPGSPQVRHIRRRAAELGLPEKYSTSLARIP